MNNKCCFELSWVRLNIIVPPEVLKSNIIRLPILNIWYEHVHHKSYHASKILKIRGVLLEQKKGFIFISTWKKSRVVTYLVVLVGYINIYFKTTILRNIEDEDIPIFYWYKSLELFYNRSLGLVLQKIHQQPWCVKEDLIEGGSGEKFKFFFSPASQLIVKPYRNKTTTSIKV